jgi:hypothetical protein
LIALIGSDIVEPGFGKGEDWKCGLPDSPDRLVTFLSSDHEEYQRSDSCPHHREPFLLGIILRPVESTMIS